MLHFFLPPRQDIANLAYPDGFRQVQAVWLCETSKMDFQRSVCAVKKGFLFVSCLENIIVHREVSFDAALFLISPVLSKRKVFADIRRNVSLVHSVMI